MDENLTRHADSRIPGGGVILSGFKSIRQSGTEFLKIPHGFHTKWPFRKANGPVPARENVRSLQVIADSLIKCPSASLLGFQQFNGKKNPL
jgi:hypothetical protein